VSAPARARSRNSAMRRLMSPCWCLNLPICITRLSPTRPRPGRRRRGAKQSAHHLPAHAQGADDEDHVPEGAHPAQGLQEGLLQEGFAARVPQAFADAGVELEQADGQQAGEHHQHQAGVEPPEAGRIRRSLNTSCGRT
jgi:hypothetical protein